MKFVSILFVFAGISLFASVPTQKEEEVKSELYDFEDSPIIISVER